MSSSQQKTIVINPELFSNSNKKTKGTSNNSTRKKERKPKPIIPDSVPNSKTLRKEFIKKIKEKQADTEKQYKLLESQKKEINENSLKVKENNKTFQDEFTKSLAFLTALTESKEKEKQKKRNEEKEKRKSFTLKRQRNNSPEIQLELPQSLQPINNVEFQTAKEYPVFEKKIYNFIPNNNFNNNSNTFKQVIDINTNISNPNVNQLQNVIDTHMPPTIPNIELKQAPPYGCLKGGTKPTYKQWTQHNYTMKSPYKELEKQKERLNIEDFQPQTEVSEREKRLQIFKNKYSLKQQSNNDNDSNKIDVNKKVKKHNYKRTIKKTTTIRNFKLGKNPKRKIVSVLIKNGATRKKIKTEVSELKRKGLSEIKEYLRSSNLLKVGSEAPPDVLRQMYETSILTGEINNLSSETLVHNYLNS